MRILHLEKQRKLSGQGISTLNLILALRRRGHEIALFCQPECALIPRLAPAGVAIHEHGMGGNDLYRAIPVLRRLARRERYDCAHAHGGRDHQMALLALLGRGTPVVRTKHNTLPVRNGLFGRILYNSSARVVAASNAVAANLRRDGVWPRKVTVVYDGIDIQRFSRAQRSPELRRTLGLRPGHTVAGVCGRLGTASLDLDTLLRAFAQLAARRPEARLLLVGRDGERKAALIADLGLKDKVILTGFRDDVPELLSQMDVYVQPNREAGLGNAVMEAMAAALPVLATRAGGIPEMVVEGVTGRLCPPGDDAAMAEALEALLTQPDTRQRMGRAAQLRAREFFDVEHMAAAMERLYAAVARPHCAER